jgi:hypothetical protein
MGPFKEKNDYFTTFDLSAPAEPKNKEGSASEDLMQL